MHDAMHNAHIENLAPAIVHSAVWSYRRLLRRCKTWERYAADKSTEKKELEGFFRSGWCDSLTGGHGQYMMARLQRETLCGEASAIPRTQKGRKNT